MKKKKKEKKFTSQSHSDVSELRTPSIFLSKKEEKKNGSPLIDRSFVSIWIMSQDNIIIFIFVFVFIVFFILTLPVAGISVWLLRFEHKLRSFSAAKMIDFK